MKNFRYRAYFWSFLLLLTFCSFGGIKVGVGRDATAKKEAPKRNTSKKEKAAVVLKKEPEKNVENQAAKNSQINNVPPRTVDTPRVTINSTGTAIVVWQEELSGMFVIKASRSTDGGVTWDSPTVISDSSYDSFNPQISLNTSGDAVVIWLCKNTGQGTSCLTTATFISGSWSASSPLSPVDEDVFGNYSATLNTSDEIVVVWSSVGDITGFQIYSISYSTLGGWTSPQLIST
jgi:hypothetical protein